MARVSLLGQWSVVWHCFAVDSDNTSNIGSFTAADITKYYKLEAARQITEWVHIYILTI